MKRAMKKLIFFSEIFPKKYQSEFMEELLNYKSIKKGKGKKQFEDYDSEDDMPSNKPKTLQHKSLPP